MTYLFPNKKKRILLQVIKTQLLLQINIYGTKGFVSPC